MSKNYLDLKAFIGRYQWRFPDINTATESDLHAPWLNINNIPSNTSLIFGAYVPSLALGGTIGPALGNNGFMISKGESVRAYCSNIYIQNTSTRATGILTTWKDYGLELIAYDYDGSGSPHSGRPFGTNNMPNGLAYGVLYFFT